MQIEYLPASHRHGVTDKEMIYIVAHAIYHETTTGRHGETVQWYEGCKNPYSPDIYEVAFQDWTPRKIVFFHAMNTGRRI